MINRRLTKLSIALTILITVFLIGSWCFDASKRSVQTTIIQPHSYFIDMERGKHLEESRKYSEAIQSYNTALSLSNRVDPKLIQLAQIAAFNRIGACYRKIGNKDAAIGSFQKSLTLGDSKYAENAIKKLR